MSDTPDDVLGPDGLLARALPGFEWRPAQLALARQVGQVMAQGGVLLAEAGTGTGKTLAYLVPAVLSGRRVVVSTGTRALQDQLANKDLPLLRGALPGGVSSAILKGRRNYLCLHRFEAAPPTDDPAWPALARWRHETPTGDRAELAAVDENAPVWDALTVNAEACLGGRCPHYEACFVTRARSRAAAADVVIVNHHLYFADLVVREAGGAALPDHDIVVFDEAHAVPDIAAVFFGVQVGTGRLDAWLRDAARAGVGAATVELGAVAAAAAVLFETLRPPEGGRAPWPDDGTPAAWVDAWLALDDALAEAAHALVARAGDGESVASLARRAAALRDDLARLFDPTDGETAVAFREARGRGTHLGRQPVDPGARLEATLYARRHAVIYTSATLAVDGGFDYARRRLGAPDEAETALFDSPFDHAARCRLFLPADLPSPGSPAHPAAVAAWTERLTALTEGRAFVLFTSVRNLEAVHARLRDRLPWPLLRQGEAPRDRLLARFRTTPGAVLLGTASFWEGVDVAGDALSLVIIDKLPFGVPDDPVLQARLAEARARGEDPFRRVQLPGAALALKQGFGRLLRTRGDRGVVAILDPRLSTRGYGKVLLRALPPAPVCRDPGELRAWWRADAAPPAAD